MPTARILGRYFSMDKSELLFYSAYEDFYGMAERSDAFARFCRDAFGEDFSQDGFSDRSQIDMILPCIPSGEDVHILDIGCGNGKMLGYLQARTGAYIHGFDYSANAIGCARRLFPERSDFRVGVIGQTEYPPASFDVVISMDSMYFAPDMTSFVGQIKRWLKPEGVFFAGYQEGDVVPKTPDVSSSLLAEALDANAMRYETTDITRQCYELLRRKRAAAEKHRADFVSEGHGSWQELLVLQTGYAQCSFEEFAKKMSRYIFTARAL